MSADEILVLLSKHHPLAQNTKIAIQDLGNYPIIIDNLPGIEAIFSEEYNTELLCFNVFFSQLGAKCRYHSPQHNAGIYHQKYSGQLCSAGRCYRFAPFAKMQSQKLFVHAKDYQLSELEREVLKHSSRILSNF